MPLEIRELVIRVDIQEAGSSQPADLDEYLASWKDKILEQCLQEVFSKLDNLSER